MTNNLIPQPNNFNSEVIKWKNEPVCTVRQAAGFYEVDETNIKTNFNRNKENFIEGKHFFTLKGADLADFKNRVTNCNAKSNLTLFTQKGMARLAKSCGSERAWEVFEELEDTYFKVKSLKDMAEDPNVLIELLIQNRSDLQNKVKMLEHTKAQISSNREAKVMANISHIKHFQLIDDEVKRLDADAINYLKPKEIGEMVEGITGKVCTPQKVNKCLIQLGMQSDEKYYDNGKYCRKVLKTFYTHKLTKAGQSLAKVVKHFNNGRNMNFQGSYKWKPEVAQMIAEFLTKSEVA